MCQLLFIFIVNLTQNVNNGKFSDINDELNVTNVRN